MACYDPPDRLRRSVVLERLFGLRRAGTTPGREVLGGFTTFVTVAYNIVVNPAILEAAGIPRGPSLVATILTARLPRRANASCIRSKSVL